MPVMFQLIAATIDFRFSMTTTANQLVITDYGNTPIDAKEENELLSSVENLDSIQVRGIRLRK